MSERKPQQAAAPPATTAAYAVVGRLPEVWGVHARGPEAVLVTDGQTLEVLGRGGLAASYARQAHHRFRPAGTVTAEPLDQLVGELAGRYGLAPLSTIR